MNVLILNTLYAPYQVGGAERSTQLLAEGLEQAGYEVVVACTRPEPGIDVGDVNGVRVYYVGLKNVYWQFDETAKRPWLKPLWHLVDTYNPWMRSQMRRIIRAERPDVVHTHNLGGFSVSAWDAAQAHSLPVVHTLRDYSLLCPRNMFRRGANCTSQCLQCAPFAAPRRRLSQRVTGVVGISRFVLERHLAYGYFEEASFRTVIHNPFPVEGSRQNAASPTARNRPLQVGFLGRLSPMKGIESLLDAVRALSEGRVHLRIGGTGAQAYEAALRSRYEGTQITFCGFVDPDAFLPTVDILVVPSMWHEPFGRVVIEAYGHGVPVVAAQRGGLPEIVETGRTGWMYDPGDDDALEQVLRSISEAPGDIVGMRTHAKRKAEQFRIDDHVKAYARSYEEARRVGGA